MPEISVVMPTLGRRASLDRALARLARQPGAEGRYDVVLVADAKADAGAVRARLEAAAAPGRAIAAPRPGASAARNAGWRATSAPLVLFLDDDVLAAPGLVATHLDAHAAQPAIGVGVLGAVRWASDVRVTPFMRWLDAGLQFDFDAIQGDETGWWHCYTANVSLKRAALEAVGGFDEDGFPFGYEDLDLAKRIDAAVGLRLLWRPDAVVEHLHEMTLDEWRSTVRRIAWSERRFVTRNPDVAPHFFDLFSAAAARPRVRGRASRLVGLVARRAPVVGGLIHGHAREHWAQELAGPFLEAWHQAAEDADPGPPPGPSRAPDPAPGG